MSMIHVHTNALATGPVAYHEFLLCYKETAREVYGLVEGKEDPMFYRGLIEKHIPYGWEVELIKSGSKNNVLETMRAFEWHRFEEKRICFFVDRDLSHFLDESKIDNTNNLYITDNYSIENESVTFGVFKRIITEVLNVTDLNVQENKKLKNLFERNLVAFKEAMSPIMAQIIHWRIQHKKTCLNNIELKNIFSFKEGSIFIKPEFESISSRIKFFATSTNLIPSTDLEIEETEKTFRLHQGVERFIRGKYMLWFMIECILEFHNSIPLIFPRYTKSPKINQSLGHKNGMVNIAPRLRCPQSLSSFIERNYVQYTNMAQIK